MGSLPRYSILLEVILYGLPTDSSSLRIVQIWVRTMWSIQQEVYPAQVPHRRQLPPDHLLLSQITMERTSLVTGPPQYLWLSMVHSLLQARFTCSTMGFSMRCCSGIPWATGEQPIPPRSSSWAARELLLWCPEHLIPFLLYRPCCVQDYFSLLSLPPAVSHRDTSNITLWLCFGQQQVLFGANWS